MADTASPTPPTPPAQPTSFLSLPRELRDMVYTLALVQPPRWHRSHLPGCPLLDTDTPWSWPVYRSTLDTVEEEKAGGFSTPDSFRSLSKRFINKNRLTEKLVQSCYAAGRQGRPSTAIRLANRQIYHETEEIFWHDNTFCYDDQEVMLHHMTAVDVQKASRKQPRGRVLGQRIAPCMPDSIKGKLQHLSVLQLRNTCSDPWSVISALQQLPNLVSVEMPSTLVAKVLKLFSSLRLPSLRTIRAGHLECVLVGDLANPRVDDGRVDLYLSKTVTLPPCSRGGHGWIEDQWVCESCREDLGRTAEEVLEPWLMTRWPWPLLQMERVCTVHWCVSELWEILEVCMPFQEEDGVPFEVEMRTPDGAMELVRIYGLPSLSIPATPNQQQHR
ncbi:hypothetical protein LTR29_003946 [Friedmanniomyces endolithicus]|nr:hypothetical protein LTR29_003946 [Friedmanniomyces endolithicus]